MPEELAEEAEALAAEVLLVELEPVLELEEAVVVRLLAAEATELAADMTAGEMLAAVWQLLTRDERDDLQEAEETIEEAPEAAVKL